jgi:hypothetical protein
VRVGLSLLELLVVVTLTLIMVGTAAFNYSQIIRDQKVGKARNECREFAKGIKQWENKHGVSLREYLSGDGHASITCPACNRRQPTARNCQFNDCGKPLPVRLFTMTDLRDDHIMPEIPLDPWSMPYEVDTTRGVIISTGADTTRGTFDDVEVMFKPRFELLRAFQNIPAGTIVVEFSRALDRSTITTKDKWFSIADVAGTPVPVTTLAVDMIDPYRVKAFLVSRPAGYVEYTVRVKPEIKARDGTHLDVSRSTEQPPIAVAKTERTTGPLAGSGGN